MSDMECVKILNNISDDTTNNINKLVAHPEINEEIDSFSKDKSRFQLTCHLFEKYILSNISIDIDTVKKVLNKLTMKFIVENNIDFLSNEGSKYEKGILLLLIKLRKEDNEEFNNIINNPKFIEVSTLCLKVAELIILSKNDVNEQIKLLEYYKSNNLSFVSNLSVELVEENIDNELFNYISEDTNVFRNMNRVNLLNLFSSNNLSKDKKKEILNDSFIQYVLSDHFVTAFCSVYTTYDEIKEQLMGKYKNKINIIDILKNSKMNRDEFFKLFNDIDLQNEIENDIKSLIINTTLNLDILKEVLISDKLLNSIENNYKYFVGILLDKPFSPKDRIDLLSNNKIMMYFTNTINNYDDISLYGLTEEEIMYIFNNELFRNNIIKSKLTILFANPKFPIEIANEYFLDDNNFYEIIGEEKGNYRYDKKEYAIKMIKNNTYLLRNFNYNLLRDDVLDMGEDIVEIFSKDYVSATKYLENIRPKYGEVFKNFVITTFKSLYGKKINKADYLGRIMNFFDTQSNLIFSRKFLKFDFENMTEEQYKVLTSIAFRYNSELYIDIRSNYKNNIYRKFNPYLYVDVEISNNDDINTYEERRINECDMLFNDYILNNDIYLAKNIFFNKYLNISIEQAEAIVSMLGTSIDSINNTLAHKYIDTIIKVLDIHSLEVLSKTYNEYNEIITFEESLYINQLIKNALSIDISNSMFSIKDGEGNTKIPNKYIDYEVIEDGIKKIKKLPIYEAGLEFRMLVHSTDAYGKLELVNNNYLSSWNDSQRTANHGICCSMISSDNLGMAKVNDVLLGFTDWDPSSLLKVAPYDIYSVNDKLYIEEGRKIKWMNATDLTNYTRHGHNELVLERMKTKKDNTEFIKIQPSYVIIYSDMTDDIKEKAYKCSYEMNIPIVYINKELLVQNEYNKLNSLIQTFYQTENLYDKIKILKDILLIHENNRSGYQNSNPEYLDKYFDNNKIIDLINYLIVQLYNIYDSGNRLEYITLSKELIKVLDLEKEKYALVNEVTERKNLPDIPFDDIIEDLINKTKDSYNDISLSNVLDLGFMTHKLERWTILLKNVNINYINVIIQNIVSNNLLIGNRFDKKYFELSLLYSYLQGSMYNFLDDGNLFNILMLCTKYSKVGYIANYIFNDNTKLIDRQNNVLDMILVKHDEYTKQCIKAILEIRTYENVLSDKIYDKYNIKQEDRNKFDLIVRLLSENEKAVKGTTDFNSETEISELFKELNTLYEEYDKIVFMRFGERSTGYAK